MPRVAILGGGVGGAIVANRLARRLRPREADLVLVDATGLHVYQPGLLYVPFGWGKPDALTRPLRRLLHPRVQLIEGDVTAIDARNQTFTVNDAALTYDWLVLATGSRLTPDRVPGFDAVHHFFDLASAARLRERLEAFEGGRIVVGPARKVYKCPPAPLEFVLLLDDALRRRGLRMRTDLHYFSPFPEVFQGKKIAALMGPMLHDRGIDVTTAFNLKEVKGGTLVSHEDGQIPFDLAVVVPPHRVAAPVEAAGLAPDGWVAVDPHTLAATGQDRIFALGDTTDLHLPKTGAVAHFQAPAVVQGIVNGVRGAGRPQPYNGRVFCMIETGGGRASIMSFDYDTPARPPRPNRLYHWLKALFNRTYWATVPTGRI